MAWTVPFTTIATSFGVPLVDTLTKTADPVLSVLASGAFVQAPWLP